MSLLQIALLLSITSYKFIVSQHDSNTFLLWLLMLHWGTWVVFITQAIFRQNTLCFVFLSYFRAYFTVRSNSRNKRPNLNSDSATSSLNDLE